MNPPSAFSTSATIGPFALVLAALVPIAALEWSYRAALKRGARDRAHGWFYGAIQLQWIGLLSCVSWTLALRIPAAHAFAFRLVPATWSGVALLIESLVPPLATMMLARRRIAALSRRLRGAEPPRAAGSGRPIRLLCAVLVLALGLFETPVLAAHGVSPLPTLVGCLVLALVILLIGRRASPGVSPASVTSGDLRDRLFALAARAGVRPRQLYLLPYARAKLANAFAVRSDTVIVTDYLLTSLGRDEVDAVMAHEMAHLQHRHPRSLALALMGFAVALGLSIALAGVSAGVFLLAPLVLPGLYVLTRRFEYAADAGALALGAKPEALISGLVRLGRANDVPLTWSPRLELLLTHPSVERRARAIGERGGLSPERVAELLASETPALESYALPPAAVAGRVFSSAWKSRAASRLTSSLLVVNTTVPAVVLAFARAAGWPYPEALVAALAVTALAAVLLVRGHAAHRFDRLRQPLEAQLRARGLGGRIEGGHFTGWSPSGEARFYEGFSIWDAGFLSLRSDRLEFVGEESAFALTHADIEHVEPVPSGPSWSRAEVVRLEWRDSQGASHAMRLTPLDATRGSSRRAAREWVERLEAWRRDAPVVAAAGVMEAPPTREVTSRSPRETAHPKVLITAATLYLPLACIVAVVLGLPLAPGRGVGMFEVWIAALAAHAVLLVPTWRYREPPPHERNAQEQRADRAA